MQLLQVYQIVLVWLTPSNEVCTTAFRNKSDSTVFDGHIPFPALQEAKGMHMEVKLKKDILLKEKKSGNNVSDKKPAPFKFIKVCLKLKFHAL